MSTAPKQRQQRLATTSRSPKRVMSSQEKWALKRSIKAATVPSPLVWMLSFILAGGTFYGAFKYTYQATATVAIKNVPTVVRKKPHEIPQASLNYKDKTLLAPTSQITAVSPKPEASVVIVASPTPVMIVSPVAPVAPVVPVVPVETVAPAKPVVTKKLKATIYRLQVGAFDAKEDADLQVEELIGAGINASTVYAKGAYRAQLGAYSDRNRALMVTEELTQRGFSVAIVEEKY
jgi:cell division protein FtsN